MSSTLTASETTISLKDIQQANLRHEGQIQIRETINKGWGVFSLQKFQRGDLVLRAKGLQTANLVARRNVDGAYDFYAHSDIVPSDEFTFDYETTEYELQSAFDCHCGDEDCRKRLKGFKYHGEDVLRVFGREYVAQYLLQGDNDDDEAHEHATTDAAAAHG
ncbi:hypothetical protein MPSEU_000030500 [Mayamaea pseudoterrestris]|nr:hypothetical protein MPSEU_000030500 [Mayamaea pseudoterrestris]